jgi:hypothetical protein
MRPAKIDGTISLNHFVPWKVLFNLYATMRTEHWTLVVRERSRTKLIASRRRDKDRQSVQRRKHQRPHHREHKDSYSKSERDDAHPALLELSRGDFAPTDYLNL